MGNPLNMKKKKSILLFLALILPILIFIFLKFFGKNEFAVPLLYVDKAPTIQEGCLSVAIPYHVPDSILRQLDFKDDSLSLVLFSTPNEESKIQLHRVMDEVSKDGIRMVQFPSLGEKVMKWKKCIFFLNEPFDLALVDRSGMIRGQYASNDRDEIDRLLIEITIIIKKY